MNKIKALLLSTTLLSAFATQANTLTSFSTDFSDNSISNWQHTGKGYANIVNEQMEISDLSVVVLQKDLSLGSHYDISMDVNFANQNGTSKGILFGYKSTELPFYTLSLKGGTWGFPIMYKHNGLYTGSVENIYMGKNTDFKTDEIHNLKIEIKKDNYFVYVDNALIGSGIEYFNPNHKDIGLFSIGQKIHNTVDNYIVNRNDYFKTSFENGEETSLEILTGSWSWDQNSLESAQAGLIVSNEDFNIEGNYSTRMLWSGDTATSDGLVFNFTDLDSPFYQARIEKISEGSSESQVVLYKYTKHNVLPEVIKISSNFTAFNNVIQDIKVTVQNDIIFVYIDGVQKIRYIDHNPLTGRRVGVLGLNPNQNSKVTYFEMTK